MTVGVHRHGVDVLDFDGVLCDSLAECTEIAWRAHTGAPVRSFGAGAPAEIVARFAQTRPYMRYGGHFVVPLLAGPGRLDRAAFTACFEGIPPERVETFVTAMSAYRAAVRDSARERWLALHNLYLPATRVAPGAYVATARDAGSVVAILGAHGVGIDPSRIFASLPHKIGALASIAERERAPGEDVRLIDDSIDNCLAAQAAGFGACWASWGYHAPEDGDIAAAHGIRALTLADLPRILE